MWGVLVGSAILLFLALVLWHLSRTRGSKPRVLVLVLGDVGRSPRMQYHALSLSQEGAFVDLVGYSGSTPLQALLESQSVAIHYLKPARKITAKSAPIYILMGILRVLSQIFQVVWLLLRLPKPHAILVQNPPAIPTLAIVQFVAFVRQSRLIIDWHNFGYSIMRLNIGRENLVVRLAKRYEQLFGRYAYGNFCVTEAMKVELQTRWGIKGKLEVLHDKPPSSFRRLKLDEIHDVRNITPESHTSPKTLVTEKIGGRTKWKADRPAVLVSSTSWTEDEDFSILLEACVKYDKKARQPKSHLPKVLLIITGKGPQQHMYLEKIRKLDMPMCQIVTAWLPIEDYPKLLGLDLPMKIVDMFGCGLPVCAYEYKTCYECDDYIVAAEKRNQVIAEAQAAVQKARPTAKPSTPPVEKFETRRMGKPKPYGAPGLVNLGNTCFFNSVMQCMAYTKALYPIALSAAPAAKASAQMSRGKSVPLMAAASERVLTKAFLNFIRVMREQLSLQKNSTVNPSNLFGHLSNKYKMYKSYRQQDSHELLRCLLDAIKEEQAQRDERGRPFPQQQTFVDSVFGGKLLSAVVCDGCKNVSYRFEDFLDLSVPILSEERKGNVFNIFSAMKKRLSRSPSPAAIRDRRDPKLTINSDRASLDATASSAGSSAVSTPGGFGANSSLTFEQAAFLESLMRPIDLTLASNGIGSGLSVQKCLQAFTSVDMLEGVNGLACEFCNGTLDPKANPNFRMFNPTPAMMAAHPGYFNVGPMSMSQASIPMVNGSPSVEGSAPSSPLPKPKPPVRTSSISTTSPLSPTQPFVAVNAPPVPTVNVVMPPQPDRPVSTASMTSSVSSWNEKEEGRSVASTGTYLDSNVGGLDPNGDVGERHWVGSAGTVERGGDGESVVSIGPNSMGMENVDFGRVRTTSGSSAVESLGGASSVCGGDSTIVNGRPMNGMPVPMTPGSRSFGASNGSLNGVSLSAPGGSQNGLTVPTQSTRGPRRKVLTKGFKRFLVHTFPEVLVVHLKRFQQVGTSGRTRKVEDMVAFREILDLAPFMSPDQVEELVKRGEIPLDVFERMMAMNSHSPLATGSVNGGSGASTPSGMTGSPLTPHTPPPPRKSMGDLVQYGAGVAVKPTRSNLMALAPHVSSEVVPPRTSSLPTTGGSVPNVVSDPNGAGDASSPGLVSTANVYGVGAIITPPRSPPPMPLNDGILGGETSPRHRYRYIRDDGSNAGSGARSPIEPANGGGGSRSGLSTMGGEDGPNSWVTMPRGDMSRSKYRLYGLVVHIGSIFGGHYVAYVRVPAPNAKGGDGDGMEDGQQQRQRQSQDHSFGSGSATLPRAAGFARNGGGDATTVMPGDGTTLTTANNGGSTPPRRRGSGATSMEDVRAAAGLWPRKSMEMGPRTKASSPNLRTQKSRKQLKEGMEDRGVNGEDGGNAEGGEEMEDIWIYCSDTQVRRSSWEEVQRAQAYLLFYERL
ncbi:mannosyltransferase [Phlyctochytrium planicorne]|nr:mannosyltransferase [Phlyctochytrium planicorne]